MYKYSNLPNKTSLLAYPGGDVCALSLAVSAAAGTGAQTAKPAGHPQVLRLRRQASADATAVFFSPVGSDERMRCTFGLMRPPAVISWRPLPR